MVDRDLMYDFQLEEEWDEWTSFGYRQMHAAFRFVGLHVAPEGLRPTSKIGFGVHAKCPFYTSCSYDLRRNESEICATKPWMAVESELSKMCWYGNAIRTLCPPQRRRTDWRALQLENT